MPPQNYYVDAAKFLIVKGDKEALLPALVTLFDRVLLKPEIVQLAKEQVSDFKLQKKSKIEIIEEILKNVDFLSLNNYIARNKEKFGLSPLELQEILSCTKTERLRWAEEKKLSIVGYRDYKYGYYPVYDWLATIDLLESGAVEQWREEHEKKVADNRKKAAQKAAITRSQQVKELKQIFDFKTALAVWRSIIPEGADFFELAYWLFASRQQAKRLKDLANRARKKEEQYRLDAKELNDLYFKGISSLVAAPQIQLSFHLVENPEFLIWSQGSWQVQDKIKKLHGFYSIQLAEPNISESFWFTIAKRNGENIFGAPHRFPSVSMLPPHTEKEVFFLKGVPTDSKIPSKSIIIKNLSKLLDKLDSSTLEEQRRNNFDTVAIAANKQYKTLEANYRKQIEKIRNSFKEKLLNLRTIIQKNVPDYLDFFELAYWARLASRAAKTFQEKGNSQQSSEFYALKNDALAIINVCPLTKLTFYRPENPDRVRWDSSYWCYIKDAFEGDIIEEDWDSGRVRIAENVTTQKDYYSLFSTTLSHGDLPDTSFEFHTPYPLGKLIYPKAEILEKEDHSNSEGEEGEFRFGRPLTEEEMSAYNPEEIKISLKEALKKFKTEEISSLRKRKFDQIESENLAKKNRLKILKEMPVTLETENEILFVKGIYEQIIKAGNKPKKARNILYYKLLEIAVVPEEVKSFPEYNENLVKQAISRKWNYQQLEKLVASPKKKNSKKSKNKQLNKQVNKLLTHLHLMSQKDLETIASLLGISRVKSISGGIICQLNKRQLRQNIKTVLNQGASLESADKLSQFISNWHQITDYKGEPNQNTQEEVLSLIKSIIEAFLTVQETVLFNLIYSWITEPKGDYNYQKLDCIAKKMGFSLEDNKENIRQLVAPSSLSLRQKIEKMNLKEFYLSVVKLAGLALPKDKFSPPPSHSEDGYQFLRELKNYLKSLN